MLTLKGRHPCGIVCFKPQKNTENLLWPPLKLFVDVEMINGVMGMGDMAKKGMRVRLELRTDTLTFTGQIEKDELKETKHREKT